MGDIRSFITDEVLVSHDKIQSAGHFTVLPTDEEGINFFTYEIDGISYKKAFTTDQSLAFDEWAGVSTVYKILNKKVYNEVNDISDLSYKHWYFLPSEEVYRRGSCEKKWWSSNIVYLWQNGQLYTVALSDEGKVTKKPCMYVHFQKRKVVAKCEVADEFLILPPGKIVTYNEEITPKFLKKYAKEKKFYFAYFKLRYKNMIKKLKK